MSVNVQMENGLKRIAGNSSITSSKIISALGYTPADSTKVDSHISDTNVHVTSAEKQEWNNKSTFSGNYNDLTDAPNIIDDESTILYIADSSGNIIAQVDENGVHSIDFHINDISIKDKIPVWDAKSEFSGDYNDLTNAPNITEDESDNYIIADPSGNIIACFDADGLTTTKVTINGVDIKDTVDKHIDNTTAHITEKERTEWNAKATPDYVDQQVAALVDSSPETLNTLNELAAALGEDPNFATTISNQIGLKADQSALNTHTNNTIIHVTATEKAKWNNKSDFDGNYNDLTNKPNITDDGSNNLVIADKNNNIIMQVDANGINTTQVSAKIMLVNGADVGAHIANKNNPHNVTKSQIGLSNVNNTSDVDKPVSTAQATAIADAKKAGTDAQTNLNTHTADTTKHITDAERTSWNNKSNFSGDYGDLSNAPNITEDESGIFYLTDSNNNIIMQVDSEGIKSTSLIVGGENIINKINTEVSNIKTYINEWDRFKLGLLPEGTELLENTDLNTMEFLKVGSYYCPRNITVETFTNCPTRLALLMQVYSPISKAYDNEETSKYVYRVRKIMTYIGEEYVQRVYSDDVPGEFVYEEWRKILTDKDTLGIPKINESDEGKILRVVNGAAAWAAIANAEEVGF